MKPKVSICVSAYEMDGLGVPMLIRCLNSIRQQTFKDYEIIVSDNSIGTDIYNACEGYNVRYLFNPNRGNSANHNYCIKHAEGELIKILDQDDYFAEPTSLQDIIDNFKDTDNWMITGCSNNPHPYYREDANTLGGCSVLTLRNGLDMYFDQTLKWILDLDLYKRLKAKFGLPVILDKVNVIIGEGAHQATYHLSNEEKLKEEQML